MGQAEVSLVSQLLGLEIQDVVVCLTHKETVSYKSENHSALNLTTGNTVGYEF